MPLVDRVEQPNEQKERPFDIYIDEYFPSLHTFICQDTCYASEQWAINLSYYSSWQGSN